MQELLTGKLVSIVAVGIMEEEDRCGREEQVDEETPVDNKPTKRGEAKVIPLTNIFFERLGKDSNIRVGGVTERGCTITLG